MISIIRIKRLRFNLEEEQVLAFRVKTDTQEEALVIGRQIWTTWMERNPGVPSQMIQSGTSIYDLGRE